VQRLSQLKLVEVLESLSCKSRSGLVHVHAGKLLWALRDRPELARSAEVLVQAVANVKGLAGRHGWLEHTYLHDNWMCAMLHHDAHLAELLKSSIAWLSDTFHPATSRSQGQPREEIATENRARMRLGAAAQPPLSPPPPPPSLPAPAAPAEALQEEATAARRALSAYKREAKERLMRWAQRWLLRSDSAVIKGVWVRWVGQVTQSRLALQHARERENHVTEDALDRHKKLKAYFMLAHCMAFEKMLAHSAARRAALSLRGCLEAWKAASWTRRRDHHHVAYVCAKLLGRSLRLALSRAFYSWLASHRARTRQVRALVAKPQPSTFNPHLQPLTPSPSSPLNLSRCARTRQVRALEAKPQPSTFKPHLQPLTPSPSSPLNLRHCARPRQVRVLVNALKRWGRMACAVAVDAWHQQARRQKRLRNAALRVVQRLRHRGAAAALRSWVAALIEMKKRRRQRSAGALSPSYVCLFRANSGAIPHVTGAQSERLCEEGLHRGAAM